VARGDDPVRLLLPGQLRLGEDGALHGWAPPPPAPPLTLLDVIGHRLERRNLNWLGFEPWAAAVFL
jgi:hypothetical protein